MEYSGVWCGDVVCGGVGAIRCWIPVLSRR